MALPTYTDLKLYLKIEHDEEDSLLQQLMTRANAILSGLLGDVPLTTDVYSFVDRCESGIQFKPIRAIMTNLKPIGGTIAVTDKNGTVVDSSTYTVDTFAGIIYAKDGYAFYDGPYTIECSVGLQYRRGYASRIEPLLGMMLIDIAADLYQRRTPAASSEAAAGTTANWNASAEVITRLMPHVKALRSGVAIS